MNLSWVLLTTFFCFSLQTSSLFRFTETEGDSISFRYNYAFCTVWGITVRIPPFPLPCRGLFSLQHTGSFSQSRINTFTPSPVLCRHSNRIWPTLTLLWELSAADQKRPSLYITHLRLAPRLRNEMKGTYV